MSVEPLYETVWGHCRFPSRSAFRSLNAHVDGLCFRLNTPNTDKQMESPHLSAAQDYKIHLDAPFLKMSSKPFGYCGVARIRWGYHSPGRFITTAKDSWIFSENQKERVPPFPGLISPMTTSSTGTLMANQTSLDR